LGLPRPRAEGISDVFGKGSLVPSPTEERALYQGAISGELSQTLEAVDGVVSARVHVVLPPTPKPGAPANPAKASAFVRVRPGMADAVGKMREDLRAVIAGGVEGLVADQVTLVINEVTAATVAKSPAARTRPALRIAIASLGVVISVVSAAVVLVALRHRRRTGGGPILATVTAPAPRHITAVPTRPPTRRNGA
jgi:type III secretion protein J